MQRPIARGTICFVPQMYVPYEHLRAPTYLPRYVAVS